ncbi:hypothetical protein E4U12_002357 [Claviceps purpurea]|nr:hypothetical protein E4U12_002357 [Claviceps purpurea]
MTRKQSRTRSMITAKVHVSTRHRVAGTRCQHVHARIRPPYKALDEYLSEASTVVRSKTRSDIPRSVFSWLIEVLPPTLGRLQNLAIESIIHSTPEREAGVLINEAQFLDHVE